MKQIKVQILNIQIKVKLLNPQLATKKQQKMDSILKTIFLGIFILSLATATCSFLIGWNS